MKLGGMTVDEMLDRMSNAEFMRWLAMYPDKSDDRQTPDEMRAALAAAIPRKKKK